MKIMRSAEVTSLEVWFRVAMVRLQTITQYNVHVNVHVHVSVMIYQAAVRMYGPLRHGVEFFCDHPLYAQLSNINKLSV